MSKKEKIVCAAVRFVRVLERTGRESNIDALCIRYDDECIKDLREKLERSLYSYTEREVLGFKTNRNRFVDPREAMKIAIDAGQIPYLRDLFDRYHCARISNPDTGVSYEAKMLFSAFDHQRSIWECRDLKLEDLY